MCFQNVDKTTCSKCESKQIVKNGKTSKGEQRFVCKCCRRCFQRHYRYQSCKVSDKQIKQLIYEGCGIRSTSRILGIAQTTLLRRILKIGKTVKRPPISFNKTYQVDELFTYIGNKDNRVCIAYSLEVETGNVIDIVIGRRNKTNLRKIISTLILGNASKITTDKLNIYKELIPKEIHSTKFRGINKIERMNLNLRTHLKRLNRKTICYSKSLAMLTAIVKIYFWA